MPIRSDVAIFWLFFCPIALDLVVPGPGGGSFLSRLEFEGVGRVPGICKLIATLLGVGKVESCNVENSMMLNGHRDHEWTNSRPPESMATHSGPGVAIESRTL